MDPRARKIFDIANKMNLATIKFIRDLHSQYNYFYQSMMSEKFGTTSEEAWALISAMMFALLKEVYGARTGGFGPNLSDEEDPEERVAKVLASTF